MAAVTNMLSLQKKNTFQLKADPFANQAEMRPEFGSITSRLSHTWKDQKWVQTREKYVVESSPLNIYEVHLGSWQREDGSFLSYQRIGKKTCLLL